MLLYWFSLECDPIGLTDGTSLNPSELNKSFR